MTALCGRRLSTLPPGFCTCKEVGEEKEREEGDGKQVWREDRDIVTFLSRKIVGLRGIPC